MNPSICRDRRFKFFLILGLAIASLIITATASTAYASDCALQRVVQLPIVDDKAPVVSILIDDQKRKVLIDTAAFWGMIDPALAAHFKITDASTKMRLGPLGTIVSKATEVPSIQIGPVKFRSVDFFVSPWPLDNADATIGANILKSFDLEIDPVSREVSLFAPNHCNQPPVYWANSGITVLPINLDSSGHVTIPIKIDGREVSALIDTGGTQSDMRTHIASAWFNVTSDSPGAQLDEAKESFTYRFKSLALGNITIRNPKIEVSAMRSSEAEFVIGFPELRNLHLYFAYGEKKLYITDTGNVPVSASTLSNQ